MSRRRYISGWVAITGIIVAALMSGLGRPKFDQAQATLTQLRRACERGFVPDPDPPPPQKGTHLDPKGWEEIIPDSLKWACDPAANLDNLNSDDMKPFKATSEAANFWHDIAVVVPLAIAIFSSIPWLWYFLLARIGEVSDAIRGKT